MTKLFIRIEWHTGLSNTGTFFNIFSSGLKCVGYTFAYVVHFIFLSDVWIRTQRAAVANRRATNLANHLHPGIRFYLHIAAGEVSMDQGRFSATEGAHNAQPDTVASL